MTVVLHDMLAVFAVYSAKLHKEVYFLLHKKADIIALCGTFGEESERNSRTLARVKSEYQYGVTPNTASYRYK